MSDTPKTPPNGSRAKGRPAPETGNKTGGAGSPAAKDVTAQTTPMPSTAGMSPRGVTPAATPAAATGTAGAGATASSSPSSAARAADGAAGARSASSLSTADAPATPPPPASLNSRVRRFEPAILPIAAALVVLVGAVAYLLSSPRERQAPAALQQADA
ncbi:MAG TPA: hypothetical protein VIL69_18775, partial [Roseomonas sp.]